VINITTENIDGYIQLTINGHAGELDFGLLNNEEKIEIASKLIEASSVLLRDEYSEVADKLDDILDELP
jgi:hypothetical protein